MDPITAQSTTSEDVLKPFLDYVVQHVEREFNLQKSNASLDFLEKEMQQVKSYVLSLEDHVALLENRVGSLEEENKRHVDDLNNIRTTMATTYSDLTAKVDSLTHSMSQRKKKGFWRKD